MKKLRLTPAASINPNSNGVLLSSDLGDFQIHGRDTSDFVEKILPLLKGELTQAEICTRLPEYGDASIEAVLQLLSQYGLLEEVSEQLEFQPPGLVQTRFLRPWQQASQQPHSQDQVYSLDPCRVLVIGLEPWAVTLLEELGTAGVGHVHLLDKENITNDDLTCHRFLTPQDIGKPRAQVFTAALQQRNPWMQISHSELTCDNPQLGSPSNDWDLAIVTLSKDAHFWSHKVSEYVHQHTIKTLYGHLDGLESWIGPVVNLDDTTSGSCWNCLRLRKLGTEQHGELAHELEKSHKKNRDGRARSMLTPMSAITGQQLAMEALKILWGYSESELVSRVMVQNLVTHQAEKHAIIPIPWCDVCGFDHSDMNTHALSMHRDTHSATNPLNQLQDVEQFKSLFEGWVDPLTGIVRQLTGHAPHLPDFPITASAGVSSFTEGEFDPRASGQVGSGKGLDTISAHISAVGEALERYSAARYRLSDCKYASISQLNGDYVDPDTLVLYSNKQYSTPNFPFHKWHRKQKIHWCRGNWLATKEPVWVPALVSYFNFACPYKEQFSQVSSNGLAAGQNNDDAELRACYELIERDAMMLTWYAQQPCERLSYEALNQGKMRVMIEELTELGIELECYLLDVGLHVPTVVCLALGDGYRTPAVSVALATHGDIKVAMRKALLEQGHVMPYLCQLMRSGQAIPQQISDVTSLEDHAAYYFSKSKLAAFDFMRRPISEAKTLEDWPYEVITHVGQLKQRLDTAGVEVAIVDVTSPDMALSPFRVARAIGVNMQPIHFGEQFKRVDNPRLRKLLQGRPVNQEPHPIA
ncbi:TOMM precursor leader peptide-binding protein [Pseudoalteromonas sp. McH1-42]|uniref:TOMM precursor leader peptide-binding protein n=1 Tax=Pseudoalteromonas sp. McH1-42 TaxID=2917752 RepID=UPI001EF5586B|nr:TOMM precursor leader peptide-binding protein [Pseudoalteromonas sp. McH1-42]MCG7561474.1 TOMM precursor leader peptide-binding protein [Pseudoalteromonas sp. McH1-42]